MNLVDFGSPVHPNMHGAVRDEARQLKRHGAENRLVVVEAVPLVYTLLGKSQTALSKSPHRW